MAGLDEQIQAAQSKLDKAKADGDKGAEATAQAELDTLNRIRGQGFVPQTDTSTAAATARTAGHTAGEKAAREALAKELGVSVDQLDAEAKKIAADRAKDQSEAERLGGQVSTLTGERDSEKTRADKAEGQLREMRISNEISLQLDDLGIRPEKRRMALRSIDRSNVKEGEDGAITGAKDAAEALQKDEVSWFAKDPPKNPPDTPNPKKDSGGGSGGDKDGTSSARSWARSALKKQKK